MTICSEAIDNRAQQSAPKAVLARAWRWRVRTMLVADPGRASKDFERQTHAPAQTNMNVIIATQTTLCIYARLQLGVEARVEPQKNISKQAVPTLEITRIPLKSNRATAKASDDLPGSSNRGNGNGNGPAHHGSQLTSLKTKLTSRYRHRPGRLRVPLVVS